MSARARSRTPRGGDELDAKRTLMSAGAVLVGVIALIVVISLIVALTNFGG